MLDTPAQILGLGNRKQTNVLLQATWQATSKAKFGLNWGESRLKDGMVNSDLRSNTNVTAGLYYGLTKSVTLVAEVSRTTSKPVAGADARMNGVAMGGSCFSERGARPGWQRLDRV